MVIVPVVVCSSIPTASISFRLKEGKEKNLKPFRTSIATPPPLELFRSVLPSSAVGMRCLFRVLSGLRSAVSIFSLSREQAFQFASVTFLYSTEIVLEYVGRTGRAVFSRVTRG